MDCRDFLSRYSDFTDGQLDEPAEVAWRRHLGACPSCQRLHAAFRAGRHALKRLPLLEPSDDFGRRLEQRLMAERVEPLPALRQWSGVAGAVLVLAVAGVIAWEVVEVRMPPLGAGVTAPGRRAGSPARPFVVRFAGDTGMDYPGRFPIIPVSRDSFSRPSHPASSFEITVDWMVP